MKRKMGSGSSMKGPKYIRQSDRLIKRMIRGMLPWDRAKGREAFKRLKCFESGNGSQVTGDGNVVVKLKHKMPRKYFMIKDVVGMMK